MVNSKIRVQYRDVAKMLAKALPVQDVEFKAKIDDYLALIKKMPAEAKLALRSAYIFSAKAPKQDREDLFQDLFLGVLKAGTKDEPFAYAIARCDWRDWWRKRMVRQHYNGGSLDKTVTNEDGHESDVAELIVGETEFERKMCDKIDSERIFSRLPEWLKPLIERRLMGKGLAKKDKDRVRYWSKKYGYSLLIA